MPNVSRGHHDERFRKKFSGKAKRFLEWLKRLILYGRLDWRRASDDAKPIRLTGRERAAYEPHFDVNAVKPRSVSAADLERERQKVPIIPAHRVLQLPTPAPAPTRTPLTTLAVDPAALAAAIAAVQQLEGTSAANGSPDPAQIAAALAAVHAQATVPTAGPNDGEPDEHRSRRRRRRVENRGVNPLSAFDPAKQQPTKLEKAVEKWLGHRR